MILDKGRVCLKIAGREAGKYCVIVEPVDESFVLITGPKSITRIKRRKCNIEHLEPTSEMLKIMISIRIISTVHLVYHICNAK